MSPPRPFASSAAAGLAFLLFGCVPDSGNRDAPASAHGERVSAVVYGDDDRREYYELVGADRNLLDATAVFIPQAALSSSAGEIRFRGPTLQELEGVCPDEPFADQLAIGQCSGFLIDERLLMTAGHCTDRMGCPSEAIVFGFHNIAEGELGPVTAGDVYSCERVLVYEEHMGGESNLGDFAILELDRPVDRTPLELTQTGWPGIGDELVLLGYPDGIPGKLARNGRVVDFDTDLEFHLHVDSFHGNSGSALYDPVAGTVAAILTHGEDDYVYDDVAGCYRVAVLDESDETVREVGNWVYAPIIELCERGYPSERICGMAEECGDGFCSFGESCDADCDAEVPEDWGCSSAWFGDGEVCHCECGAVDPDCVEDSEVDGCRPGQGCGTDGLCGPGDIEWTCDPEFFGYGTGDGCDCACGAYDPDCDDGGPVINCGAGAICDADGECVGGIAVPSEWDCNLAYYAAGDDCDCECGTYDPDCDVPGAEVLSCEAGETCSEIGECVPAGAPVDAGHPDSDLDAGDSSADDSGLGADAATPSDASGDGLDAATGAPPDTPLVSPRSSGCAMASASEQRFPFALLVVFLGLRAARRRTD